MLGTSNPSDQDTSADLGASPGSWTSALLLYSDGLLGATIISSSNGRRKV